jgi:hypothetical protein
MQIAQRQQQRSHLSSDLHDGQADALKCPQDQFYCWGGSRACGLTRIESCDLALKKKREKGPGAINAARSAAWIPCCGSRARSFRRWRTPAAALFVLAPGKHAAPGTCQRVQFAQDCASLPEQGDNVLLSSLMCSVGIRHSCVMLFPHRGQGTAQIGGWVALGAPSPARPDFQFGATLSAAPAQLLHELDAGQSRGTCRRAQAGGHEKSEKEKGKRGQARLTVCLRCPVCLLGSTDIMGMDAHTVMADIREYAAGELFTPVLHAHSVMMAKCTIDAGDEAHS